MKKKLSTLSFILLLIILLVIIINSLSNGKIYLRYKYGDLYNQERLNRGIPVLPESFVYIRDDYYSNILIWENKVKKINDSNYSHLRKQTTARDNKILLEEDFFQIYINDSVINELVSKYYFENNFRVLISNRYVNSKLISRDTIAKLDDELYNLFLLNRSNLQSEIIK